ncbi:hypothetical protein BH10PSE10_BH10PSE10_22050 [soil metagenome]
MINSAVIKAMDAYNMLHNRSSDLDGVARKKVTDYISALFEFGETNPGRLMSMGLLYLTDLDETDQRPDEQRRFH